MAARLERDFEDEVVEVLTAESGWVLGAAQDLDLATGINSADLVAFIGQTQADEWEKWLKPFPDVDAAQVALRKRVAAEVDHRGTIDVLRNGVKGNGCKFSLCYFISMTRKSTPGSPAATIPAPLPSIDISI